MISLIIRLLITVVFGVFSRKIGIKSETSRYFRVAYCRNAVRTARVSLINQEILDAGWYQISVHVLECAVGLMIGTELVWNKIKKSGKAIIITTLTQSLGTFLVVSLVFGIAFYLTDVPLYLSFIFGGIALATAPAPALSIVREL